jgi:hypothetical protein
MDYVIIVVVIVCVLFFIGIVSEFVHGKYCNVVPSNAIVYQEPV